MNQLATHNRPALCGRAGDPYAPLVGLPPPHRSTRPSPFHTPTHAAAHRRPTTCHAQIRTCTGIDSEGGVVGVGGGGKRVSRPGRLSWQS